MVRPERRTRSDLVAVVLILVVVLAAAAVIWWRSDARATTSEPAAAPAPVLTSPTRVPAALHELWRAPSPATPVPVVAGSTAITGDGGTVSGRDPGTGAVRWRFSRDLPLCTVGEGWDRAVAVYRKSANCSEVSSLQGDTGVRGPARNADAPFGTRLLDDGKYLTATGERVLESWRSDLVRTQQYGIMPALKNAGNNLRRPNCTYPSVAVGSERIAVVEDCPDDPAQRITVLKTKPEDDEEPEEVSSAVLGGSEATAVAVSTKQTAVYVRDRGSLVVYANSTGGIEAEYPLPTAGAPFPDAGVEAVAADRVWTVNLRPVPGPEQAGAARSISAALHRFDPAITEQRVLDGLATAGPDRPFRVAVLDDHQYRQVKDKIGDVPGATFGGLLYWNNGATTVALDAATFAPLWEVPGALGPGALHGGKLLVPMPAGIAVLDRFTGARERLIPVDRQGWDGPVRLDSAGTTVLEQRGPNLVALG
ncbi:MULTISPECIES: hypothetical protein [unclassified Saccharopolyspora]|uniref:Rv3212 family protein n=1 Tax=unclassified Saccharopolyspora TaxID=2646250 RepID=UPI001CD3DC8C|nr:MULTISPECIES: hypothetical protein [unclassified Saccharopolyspora]MCA1185491.1 hypothetical protein [Saccharopolyspora sp. 6T]MCA1192286.1 hypothetical protein [Saccharopolyspora sp. 6V]MCA1279593.1 hypothetical protein [Saccharopolyspora sp. 7B]